MGSMNSIGIKEAVSTLEKVTENAPSLDLGNRIGVTDYIDFISPDEVKNGNMKGVDVYGRKFYVFKGSSGKKKFFQTFFQRYSDNERIYMGAGQYYPAFLMDTTGGMNERQFELLITLVNDRKLTITETLKESCKVFYFEVGDVVVLD